MLEYAVILLILGVVGYWVCSPLVKSQSIEKRLPQRRENRQKILQEKKEDVYTAIKEMEFDFEMGKISKEDYRYLKDQYKVKALGIVKELERVKKSKNVKKFESVEPKDPLDVAIEREVQQLRGKKKPKGKREKGKETEGQTNFCPQCGTRVAPNSNFCQNCGVKLEFPQKERG
jgi:hypothetical protein